MGIDLEQPWTRRKHGSGGGKDQEQVSTRRRHRSGAGMKQEKALARSRHRPGGGMVQAWIRKCNRCHHYQVFPCGIGNTILDCRPTAFVGVSFSCAVFLSGFLWITHTTHAHPITRLTVTSFSFLGPSQHYGRQPRAFIFPLTGGESTSDALSVKVSSSDIIENFRGLSGSSY